MTKTIMRALAPVTLAVLLAGCGGGGNGEAGEKAGAEKTEGAEASEAKEGPKDIVTLSAQQIADAAHIYDKFKNGQARGLTIRRGDVVSTGVGGRIAA